MRADLYGLARVLEFAEMSEMNMGDGVLVELLMRATGLMRVGMEEGAGMGMRSVADALVGLVGSKGECGAAFARHPQVPCRCNMRAPTRM